MDGLTWAFSPHIFINTTFSPQGDAALCHWAELIRAFSLFRASAKRIT